MKTFITSIIVAVLTIAATGASAIADEKGPGKNDGVSGAVGRAVNDAAGGAERAVDGAARKGAQVDVGPGPKVNIDSNRARLNVDPKGSGVNLDANPARLNVEPNRGRVNVDSNRARVNVERDRSNAGLRTDRNGYFIESDRARIGDRDFDRRGIGIVNEDRFRDRQDNRWRYRNWNNQWWYWMPAGYWMFYRDGNWARYDVDSYASAYPVESAQPVRASGPYYEDQSGFFYYDGNRKVYDPQIQRVGVAGAEHPCLADRK